MSKIVKVRKKFTYDGLELQIVDREETGYYNDTITSVVTRVIAPNGGLIVFPYKHNDTLKAIAEKAINYLDDLKKRGANIQTELTMW